MAQQAQLTLIRIVSAGDGSDYLAMSAPALGEWLVIRRVRSATATDFYYWTTESKEAFVAVIGSAAAMSTLPFRRRTPFGFDSTFLMNGAGLVTAPTAAVPTTDDGAPVYAGSGPGSGGSEDSAMEMLAAQRLSSLDNKLHTNDEGKLLVSMTFPQKLMVDVINGTLDVNVVSAPQLPDGAATAAGQDAIEARLGLLLDQLLALAARQQTDALTNEQLRAAPLATTPALPPGAATAAKQEQLLAGVAALNDKLGTALRVVVDNPPAAAPAQQHVVVDGTVPVSGPLTDAQLRATAVPVSIAAPVPVTGTFWQATQPVSLASAPLPANAATAANQNLEITALNSIDTKVATATRQDAGNASLASIDQKLTNPLPVSLAFPATQPVSALALPLPAGAATAALQTAGNASLSSLDAKLPALVGGRVPVTVDFPNPLPVSGAFTAAAEVFSSKVFTSQLTASANAFLIKASAGVIKRVVIGTAVSSTRYCFVYNKATAPGATDTPVATIIIPAAPTPSQVIDLNINCPAGIYLTLSANIGVLGLLTSALGLNEVVVTACYT